ncbi:MAG: hypothetical protein QOH85_599, partial [Acidobacteriaceae bacterium]|nr:hypothetical protein [Acidobacteriaceae bacterium]
MSWSLEPLLCNEGVEIGGTVIGIGIARVSGVEIIRQAGQARVLGREIEKGDLLPGRFGRSARWQQGTDRLVEL